MVEIERNPLAVRQGAAAVACIAAAAVAMPVIAHRAAEQRGGAEWAARNSALHEIVARNDTADAQLTMARGPDGLRARGAVTLLGNSETSHALLVQAALRGPLAPNANATPIEPVNARELECLSQAVYFEARGESYRGQVAVAEVVMNRVRSRLYPNTVCKVVYQGSHRQTGCQFTFTCDGSLDRRPRGRAWEQAQHVAAQVMGGFTRQLTHRATHYHTNAVNPVWSAGLVETATIGEHIFYRFPNRAERPQYALALAERRARSGAFARADEPPLLPATDDALAVAVEAEEADGVTDEATPVDAAAEPAEGQVEASDAPVATAGTEVST